MGRCGSPIFGSILGIVMVLALLNIQPALGSPVISSDPGEKPPPLTVILTYNSLVLNLSDNVSAEAVYPGTVQTNYPGLELDVYFGARCGDLETTVDPEMLTMRGIANATFMIRIAVPPEAENNTGCMGSFWVVWVHDPPLGSTQSSTSRGSLSLEIHKEEPPEPTPLQYGEDRPTTPEAQTKTDNLSSVMAVLVIALVVTVLYILEGVARKRYKDWKRKKRRSKRRRKR